MQKKVLSFGPNQTVEVRPNSRSSAEQFLFLTNISLSFWQEIKKTHNQGHVSV